MFQLQQVWPHGEGMLEEEGKRNEEMFQMQQRRTHCQGL